MRLINIHTFDFKEFFDADVPPYAILSHRWGKEELTFKEVAEARINKTKQGYKKVESACNIASQYEVDYLWSDTCCINKDSNAELSEAINSMFQWYRTSKICLTYLADIESGMDFGEACQKSVWFNRAWTLQELLAPCNVDFFNNRWICIGSKIWSSEILETKTGIPAQLLRGTTALSDYLIAQKMSWAAGRVATRPEDIAYSLLGIFDVNMPPLYGEGMKAFLRLQEEIIRHTKDPTFLYWEPAHSGTRNASRGRLLARNPSDFAGILAASLPTTPIPIRFSVTNIDLDAGGSLVRWAPLTYALLLAQSPTDLQREICSAVLLRTHATSGEMYKIGVCNWDLPLEKAPMNKFRKITLLRDSPPALPWPRKPHSNFGFDIKVGANIEVSVLGVRFGDPPREKSRIYKLMVRDRQVQCIFDDQEQPAVARLRCTIEGALSFFVDITFDFDCQPCAMLSTQKAMKCVWQASENIIPDDRLATHSDKATIHILGEEAESPSYFIRGSHYFGTRAKLPKNFIPAPIQVMVRFTCGWHAANNDAGFCGFDMWTYELPPT